MCWHFSKFLRLHICLLGVLILAGCSNAKKSPQTLTLTLTAGDNGFQVVDYQANENGYQDSHSQGGYRVHLIDDNGKILRKIGFQLMNNPSSQNRKGRTFKLPLPLVKELHSVLIYKLDLSSGNYQLQGNDPLLNCTLPDSLAK